ncbi:DUF3331 domain-containing protein [Burkholderia stagnalis]
MPNIMENLIREIMSCDAAVSGEREAMPSFDTVGMPRLSPEPDAGRAPVSGRVAAGASPLRPQLFVTVLEAGDDALLVRWSESGRCHYGEQRWRLRVALQPGRCAISGRPIEPGESVYRPVRRPVPANADEMICPAAVLGAAGAARAVAVAHDEAADPADALG